MRDTNTLCRSFTFVPSWSRESADRRTNAQSWPIAASIINVVPLVALLLVTSQCKIFLSSGVTQAHFGFLETVGNTFWRGTRLWPIGWTRKKRHRLEDETVRNKNHSLRIHVTRFQVVHPFVSMPPVVRLIPFCYRFFRPFGFLSVYIFSILQCVYRFVREMFCLIRLLSFYS